MMSSKEKRAGERPSLPSARPKVARRALWLGVYLGVLMLVASFVVSRQVSAELSERSLGLGRKLDAFQDFSGPLTELSWNGQALAVSTLVMDLPIDRVLGRFVEVCSAGTGRVPRELAESLGIGDRGASLLQRALVMRDLFPDGTGSAVCLSGLGEGGLSSLLQRARRFSASMDVSELGQLRFAFLRKVSDARTQVILASADGPLRLDKLVPLDGRDADGFELVEGVRPAEATRLFSASAKGTPHAITAYSSRLTPDAALTDYGQKLMAKGLVRAVSLRPSNDGAAQLASADRIMTEAYRDGPRAFVVTSQPDDETGGSLLSVVQLAADAIPSPHQAAEVGRTLVGRGQLGAPRDHAFE